jgi:hypothetical protein
VNAVRAGGNDVGLDGRERKFPWPDAGRLDRDRCGQRINQQYPDFPEQGFLIQWIQALYVRIGRICGGACRLCRCMSSLAEIIPTKGKSIACPMQLG